MGVPSNARKLLLVVCTFGLLFSNKVPEANAAMKRRVAVLPFDYGAVRSEVGTYDVGKGVTSLLITKLVNDGTYSVVDREMLNSILTEQNLSVSDRADQTTACKIGKILSVDAIIVGTITQFGFETKTTNIGGLASLAGRYVPYGGGYSSFGLGSSGVRKSKVRVAIDARIIDVNTTEILGAVHGDGESTRKGMTLFNGVGPDIESSGFATSIAGEASLQAVDAIGNQLEALASKIPDNESVVSGNFVGEVADVSDNQVILNVGKIHGVQCGDNFEVKHIYKRVMDPANGRLLKELTHTIAVITIKEVDSNSCTGIIAKGTGIKIGDTVSKLNTPAANVSIYTDSNNNNNSDTAASFK